MDKTFYGERCQSTGHLGALRHDPLVTECRLIRQGGAGSLSIQPSIKSPGAGSAGIMKVAVGVSAPPVVDHSP